MEIMTWEELAQSEVKEPEWLIDPYVAREGITLLWGKWSTCKSPLTWQMAYAVGQGTNFFGLPCTQGRVLYIEVDSPENVAKPRIQKLPPSPNVWFAFSKPLSLGLNGLPPDQHNELRELNEVIKPDMVILNTLRKLHDLDDKDSKTPKLVYSTFQHIFPKSALIFVHHERKSSQDPRYLNIGSEAFSGSQHWIDDAQSGLQMEVFTGKRETHRLWHRKSQMSERLKPLGLVWDGNTLDAPLYGDLLCVYEGFHQGLTGGKLDAFVSEERKIGPTTARARRLLVESGKFPGSRKFLAVEGGEFEDDD